MCPASFSEHSFAYTAIALRLAIEIDSIFPHYK